MQTVEGGAREVGLLLSWGRGREVGLNELGDSLLSTELEGKLHDTYTLAHTGTPSGTFTHTFTGTDAHSHSPSHCLPRTRSHTPSHVPIQVPHVQAHS